MRSDDAAIVAAVNVTEVTKDLDVGREYGTRARLSQYVDMIGSFTQALLCGLRQFDNGPQNLVEPSALR